MRANWRRSGINLDVLAEEDADAAHHTLTALHGIGPWTADVYLLFCLGHGDAWPAGDLAVQEAVKIGLGLKTRPTAKQMAPLAEPWRPLRGAAAHLWWSYYRVLKKREGVISNKPRAIKQTAFETNGVLNSHRRCKCCCTMVLGACKGSVNVQNAGDRDHELHRLRRCPQ